MKINPKIFLWIAVGIALGFVLANLKLYKHNRYTVTEMTPTPSIIPVNNFSITDTENKPQLVNLSENESEKIESVVDTFEKFKYLKDYVKAINMITPPENKDEQGWLDYYLGNDLTLMNNGKPSPRFTLNVNFHYLVSYKIEKITKKDNIYYVDVGELRIISTENAKVAYKTNMQNLTFEVIDDSNNFKISMYYHTKPTSIANLKYEGFVAY
jgi:hypothetical protein